MVRIAVDFPAYIFGDNQSALANSTNPDSALKKKSTSIAYHFVRERVAKGEWLTTYVSTHDNPATDLLTKPSISSEKRMKLIRISDWGRRCRVVRLELLHALGLLLCVYTFPFGNTIFSH